MTVPVTEAKETTLNLTDFLTDSTELYSDPWGVQDFTPTPQPFTENNSTNQTPTNNGADSDLDDTDLDKILTDIKPKSTVNAELWAMNRFHGNYFQHLALQKLFFFSTVKAKKILEKFDIFNIFAQNIESRSYSNKLKELLPYGTYPETTNQTGNNQCRQNQRATIA